MEGGNLMSRCTENVTSLFFSFSFGLFKAKNVFTIFKLGKRTDQWTEALLIFVVSSGINCFIRNIRLIHNSSDGLTYERNEPIKT